MAFKRMKYQGYIESIGPLTDLPKEKRGLSKDYKTYYHYHCTEWHPWINAKSLGRNSRYDQQWHATFRLP